MHETSIYIQSHYSFAHIQIQSNNIRIKTNYPHAQRNLSQAIICSTRSSPTGTIHGHIPLLHQYNLLHSLRPTSSASCPIRHSRKQPNSLFDHSMQSMFGSLILISVIHKHGSDGYTGRESRKCNRGDFPTCGLEIVGYGVGMVGFVVLLGGVG